MLIRLSMLGVFVLLTCCAGCSNPLSPAVQLAEVSGQVTLDELAVSGATVIFLPTRLFDESNEKIPISIGTTDENGQYRLQTISGEPGAAVGAHIVLIKKSSVVEENVEDRDPEKTPSAIHEAIKAKMEILFPGLDSNESIPTLYNRRSILSYRVSTGFDNRADFALSSVDPILSD